MKKISIFLVTLNQNFYCLFAILIGVIVWYRVGSVQEMVPISNFDPLILFLIIFGFFSIHPSAQSRFYTDQELTDKRISGEIMGIAFPITDKYFKVKINQELSICQRIWGYVYAMSWPIHRVVVSYLIFVLICLAFNNLKLM